MAFGTMNGGGLGNDLAGEGGLGVFFGDFNMTCRWRNRK